jgi:hypothetical protein
MDTEGTSAAVASPFVSSAEGAAGRLSELSSVGAVVTAAGTSTGAASVTGASTGVVAVSVLVGGVFSSPFFATSTFDSSPSAGSTGAGSSTEAGASTGAGASTAGASSAGASAVALTFVGGVDTGRGCGQVARGGAGNARAEG